MWAYKENKKHVKKKNIYIQYIFEKKMFENVLRGWEDTVFAMVKTYNKSYYLNEIDAEVDWLLASTDVVGDDIRDEGLFWPAGVRLLLRMTEVV